MKFWKVTVFNSYRQCNEVLGVAGDDSYDSNRIRDIILSAHPEYDKITVETDEEPKDWVWSEYD